MTPSGRWTSTSRGPRSGLISHRLPGEPAGSCAISGPKNSSSAASSTRTRPTWSMSGTSAERTSSSPSAKWRSGPGKPPLPVCMAFLPSSSREGGRGRLAVRAHQWHVVDGEGAFPAQVTGEGEPPAEQRSDAVAEAGEDADVDELLHNPAREAVEVHLERRAYTVSGGDR